MEPQQLELILKLADKVSSFPLPGLKSLGFSSLLCILWSFVCWQDVSTGVLVSENVSALQRKLWATVCSFVHDAAWQKRVDFMLM